MKYKKEVFFEDKTLRDVNITNISKLDWYKIIIFLKEKWINFSINNEKKDIDILMLEISNYFISQNGETILLTVDINNIKLNWFFMLWSGDFLDVNPIEVKEEEDIKNLINFLKEISILLNKKIYISPESSPETKLLEI